MSRSHGQPKQRCVQRLVRALTHCLRGRAGEGRLLGHTRSHHTAPVLARLPPHSFLRPYPWLTQLRTYHIIYPSFPFYFSPFLSCHASARDLSSSPAKRLTSFAFCKLLSLRPSFPPLPFPLILIAMSSASELSSYSHFPRNLMTVVYRPHITHLF